jgi:hypothetical protein
MGLGTKDFVEFIKEHNLDYLGKRSVTDYWIRPKYELYDLEMDSMELYNLAYKEDYQAIVRYYVKRLYKFQDDTDDLWGIYQDYDLVDDILN